MKVFLAWVGFLSGLLPAVVANSSHSGKRRFFSITVFDQGDYATALSAWRPVAEKGDPTARHNIDFMHQTAKGGYPELR